MTHGPDLVEVADKVPGQRDRWQRREVVLITTVIPQLFKPGLLRCIAVALLDVRIEPGQLPDVQRQVFADSDKKLDQSSRNLLACAVM